MTRASIHIDEYNFYRSRLQGTGFKCLDVVALFREQIVRAQASQATVTVIQYLTAPIKANYARHGQTSGEAETQYVRAIQARVATMLEIIKGFHIFKPVALPA